MSGRTIGEALQTLLKAGLLSEDAYQLLMNMTPDYIKDLRSFMEEANTTGHSPSKARQRAKDLDFYDALRLVGSGKRISRREWNTAEAFVALTDGFLKIHQADGRADALLVRDVDLSADDWFIVHEN